MNLLRLGLLLSALLSFASPALASSTPAGADLDVRLGWVAIAAAVIGAYSSYDSSKRQSKAAKDASGPQPYWSESSSGPPDWFQAYIQDALPRVADQYQNNLNNPRVPPTFYDVTAGRHSTPLPTGVYGGIQPQNTTDRVRDAWARQEAKWADDDPETVDRTLTDKERQKIAERVMARHPGEAPSFGPGARMPVGRGPGFQHPQIPERGGGGGGGGRGGGGGGRDISKGRDNGMSPRRQMEQLVLQRAQKPVMGQQEGMDFITNLLGKQDNTRDLMGPAMRQQNQTYKDIRSESSVLNQLARKGLEGGFSSAAPMQRQLAQNLLSGMNAPAPGPVSYFDRYLDMANDPSRRLVDFSAYD